jgi:hypothetical protein
MDETTELMVGPLLNRVTFRPKGRVMKKLYVRSFGTDVNGKVIYEWTEDQTSAALYHRTQADIDCDLLNRHSLDRITPEVGEERLVFENYRVVEMAEGQFGIAFESRAEAERSISTRRG